MTLEEAATEFRAAKAAKADARFEADKAVEASRMANEAFRHAIEKYEIARDALLATVCRAGQ
jgi:hypothetical protein